MESLHAENETFEVFDRIKESLESHVSVKALTQTLFLFFCCCIYNSCINNSRTVAKLLRWSEHLPNKVIVYH